MDMHCAQIKVFIIGKGYIGSYLLKNLKTSNIKCLNIERSIYTNTLKLNNFLKEHALPGDIIINCAAYIGKDSIKDCEDDIDQTLETNSNLPCRVFAECIAQKLRFIHISTGGLFQCQNNINKAYTEGETPNNTLSAYYFSKFLAELALNGISGKHPSNNLTIVRIHMPISETIHKNNLACKLIKYPILIDNVNTITPLCDLVNALKCIIEYNLQGTFNVVNPSPIKIKRIYDIISNNRSSDKTIKEGVHETILDSSKIDKKSGQRVFCNLSDHLAEIGSNF